MEVVYEYSSGYRMRLLWDDHRRATHIKYGGSSYSLGMFDRFGSAPLAKGGGTGEILRAQSKGTNQTTPTILLSTSGIVGERGSFLGFDLLSSQYLILIAVSSRA